MQPIRAPAKHRSRAKAMPRHLIFPRIGIFPCVTKLRRQGNAFFIPLDDEDIAGRVLTTVEYK